MIDGEWIKARLTGQRGEKATLARTMGIRTDQLSRILSGERSVQPEELPRLLEYFGESIGPTDQPALVQIIADHLPYLDQDAQDAIASLVKALARPSKTDAT